MSEYNIPMQQKQTASNDLLGCLIRNRDRLPFASNCVHPGSFGQFLLHFLVFCVGLVRISFFSLSLRSTLYVLFPVLPVSLDFPSVFSSVYIVNNTAKVGMKSQMCQGTQIQKFNHYLNNLSISHCDGSCAHNPVSESD